MYLDTRLGIAYFGAPGYLRFGGYLPVAFIRRSS
jgi:hypothetical protein